MESDLVRWKWKCVLCKKAVSSRQSAVKHIGIYHPSENISGNITKIFRQLMEVKKLTARKLAINELFLSHQHCQTCLIIIAGLKIF